VEQASRDCGYFVHRSKERGLVGLRRFIKPGNLPNELQRRRSNLVFVHGWIEIKKSLDISAHSAEPPALVLGCNIGAAMNRNPITNFKTNAQSKS
jgi:hypothetical protein